eukprot:jgi/Mesvir1/2425/Mv22160-RA.1
MVLDLGQRAAAHYAWRACAGVQWAAAGFMRGRAVGSDTWPWEGRELPMGARTCVACGAYLRRRIHNGMMHHPRWRGHVSMACRVTCGLSAAKAHEQGATTDAVASASVVPSQALAAA